MRFQTPRPARTNQRLSTPRQRKQQHLLDVKVRSRKAAEQRNQRVITWGCRIVLAVGLVWGAVFGVKQGLARFLWENPDYVLTSVEVSSDGPLSRQQIVEIAGCVRGRTFSQSIFPKRASV